MKRVRKTKPFFKQFVRKPKNRCVVCLYQIGLPLPAISQQLHVKPENILSIIFRADIRRGVFRFGRRKCFKKRKSLPSDKMVVRLVMQQYRKELHVAKKLDEPRHWWRHPVRKAWRIEKIQRKIRESNQARFAQELVGFKCQFCGRDASAIPPSRRQFGLKYCSGECREKASIAAEKLRLESDPGLRQRKREYIKKCYHRTRRERPEVYRDRVRRKLADPLYRIAKSHRNRLNELIRKGLFRKTKSSLKYFGCTSAHLKQHLESKFKPGMTWENHGKVWHVDHIKALRGKGNFDLMNAADCACAFNWSNLQPLFAQANREKSNKVIDAPASLALVVT